MQGEFPVYWRQNLRVDFFSKKNERDFFRKIEGESNKFERDFSFKIKGKIFLKGFSPKIEGDFNF